MSALARPAVAASLLAGAALALHPLAAAADWLPERDLVLAALVLLAAVALVARALAVPRGDRFPAALVAAGAVAVVGALGADGVAGRHGRLVLGVGQARSHFEEAGPTGAALGLRPLGLTIGVEEVRPGGVVLLSVGGGPPVELPPDRAVSRGGFRFALLEVVPEEGVAMAVHREPAWPVLFGGGILLAAGLAAAAWRARRSGGAAALDPPLVAGAAVSLALLLLGPESALAWTLSVPGAAGPLPLRGAGVLLGLGLLAALLGTLLLAAERAAGREVSVRPAGHAALWGAVALLALGAAIGGVQVTSLGAVTLAAAAPVLGLAGAAGVMALALVLARLADAGAGPAPTAWLLPAAVAAVVLAGLAAAALGLRRDGSYATPLALSVAATGLLGLASLEPTGWPGVRRLAFLLAALLLVLRPL